VETRHGPLHEAPADISARPSALRLDNAHCLVFKHDFYVESKDDSCQKAHGAYNGHRTWQKAKSFHHYRAAFVVSGRWRRARPLVSDDPPATYGHDRPRVAAEAMRLLRHDRRHQHRRPHCHHARPLADDCR
jgi:hypothetical protein